MPRLPCCSVVITAFETKVKTSATSTSFCGSRNNPCASAGVGCLAEWLTRPETQSLHVFNDNTGLVKLFLAVRLRVPKKSKNIIWQSTPDYTTINYNTIQAPKINCRLQLQVWPRQKINFESQYKIALSQNFLCFDRLPLGNVDASVGASDIEKDGSCSTACATSPMLVGRDREIGVSTKTGVRDGSVLVDRSWSQWFNKLLLRLKCGSLSEIICNFVCFGLRKW